MAGEEQRDPKDQKGVGEHFIVNLPTDPDDKTEAPREPSADIVREPSADIISEPSAELKALLTPVVDIVSEPSAELKALQQEVSGFIRAGAAVHLGDISDDRDTGADVPQQATPAPRSLPSYIADGDLCDEPDCGPTSAWHGDGPRTRQGEKARRSGSEGEFPDEGTLAGGRHDPTVEACRDLVRPQHGKQLTRLRDQIAQCVIDVDNNYANINFDRLEANLMGIGKAEVFDRAFTIVRTRQNLFIVSNENLLNFQDTYQELMGIDLTRSSRMLTASGKPIYFTLVTAADLEVMRKTQTAAGRISASCIAERRGHIGQIDSLLIPELELGDDPSERVHAGCVDLDEFKAKVAHGARVPGSIVYFDPKDFADKVEFVMSFYNDEGQGYYLITTLDGDEQQSYLMYVKAQRPVTPDLSNICFTYGDEFCTLVPED